MKQKFSLLKVHYTMVEYTMKKYFVANCEVYACLFCSSSAPSWKTEEMQQNLKWRHWRKLSLKRIRMTVASAGHKKTNLWYLFMLFSVICVVLVFVSKERRKHRRNQSRHVIKHKELHRCSLSSKEWPFTIYLTLTMKPITTLIKDIISMLIYFMIKYKIYRNYSKIKHNDKIFWHGSYASVDSNTDFSYGNICLI